MHSRGRSLAVRNRKKIAEGIIGTAMINYQSHPTMRKINA
jgi:hypothetical protein